MSGRGNYCQESANILKHLFKRHDDLDLSQHFRISDTGYTVSIIEGLEQIVAIELCSEWHYTKKNTLQFFYLGIQPCESSRLQGLRYMHRAIIPLVPGLLQMFMVIINVWFNRWLEPVQFLLRGRVWLCNFQCWIKSRNPTPSDATYSEEVNLSFLQLSESLWSEMFEVILWFRYYGLFLSFKRQNQRCILKNY